MIGAVAIGEVKAGTGVQICHCHVEGMASLNFDTPDFGHGRIEMALQGAAIAIPPLAGALDVPLGVFTVRKFGAP